MKHILSIIYIVIFLNTLKFYSQIYTPNFPVQNGTMIPLEQKGNNFADNTYYTDINGVLNKFIGTWQYTSSTISFKIQFYKLKVKERFSNAATTTYHDEIRSYIEYKTKIAGTNIWTTVYNTFPAIQVFSEELNVRSIRGASIHSYNLNEITLDYDEPTTSCIRTKNGFLDLTYSVVSGVATLNWQRRWFSDTRFENSTCDDGTPIDDSEFKVPANMVLTKVN